MKKRMFARSISLLLCIVMVLGMFPAGLLTAAAEEVPAQASAITIDFKQFAKEISQQDWWDDLCVPTGKNVVDNGSTRFVGRAVAATAMTADELAAYDALREYLAQNEAWQIDETASNFKGWLKRLYFNNADSVPWGLNYYAYYHGNSTAPERADLALTVTAPADGWYQMKINGFRHNVSFDGSTAITGFGSGGGYIDLAVNGKEICKEYSLKPSDYPQGGNYYLSDDNMGYVYLNEGENSVILTSPHAHDGPTVVVGGRCNVSLAGMSFTPVEGVMELLEGTEKAVDLTQDWLYFGTELSADTHEAVSSDEDVLSASITEDGRVQLCANAIGEAELTVYEGETELCVIPVAVTELVNEAKQAVVADFKAFAKKAETQSWWNDLISATTVDGAQTRRIGNSVNQKMTQAQYDAYKAMQDYLTENEDWSFAMTYWNNNTASGQRGWLCADDSIGWGLCYNSYYIDRDGHLLEVNMEVPDSGWYALELDISRQGISDKDYANDSLNAGGAYIDVMLDGSVVSEYLETKGAGRIQPAFGAVYLEKGTHVVGLMNVANVNGLSSYTTPAAYSGRTNLNLRSITLKPLAAVEVGQGQEEVYPLRGTWLASDCDVSALEVSCEEEFVQAAMDESGNVTILGVAAGEAEIVVLRGGEEVCAIAVTVTDQTALQARDGAVTVTEDGWYQPDLAYYKEASGSSAMVYLEDHYLGNVYTRADERHLSKAQLYPVYLEVGEYAVRTEGKVSMQALSLRGCDAPQLSVLTGDVQEKQYRLTQTPIVAQWQGGLNTYLPEAQWTVEVSDEAALQAQVVPGTETAAPILQVTGLQPVEGWVKITAEVGDVKAEYTANVTVLAPAKLTSADVEIAGVTTGQVARASVRSFSFDLVGEDGDVIYPNEVPVSYEVSDESLLRVDEMNHTLYTLANGEATVTVTIGEGEDATVKTFALTIADTGENLLDAASSGFEGGVGNWSGLKAPGTENAYAWSEVVDDGTGNMALQMKVNPEMAYATSSVGGTIAFNYGTYVPVIPGQLYEMSFRIKASDVVIPENGYYSLRTLGELYDYASASGGAVVNEIFSSGEYQLAADTDGWVEVRIPVRTPVDYDGPLYVMPRFGVRPVNTVDNKTAGYEATVLVDDFSVHEVGFSDVRLTQQGEMYKTELAVPILMEPLTTTGTVIRVDDAAVKGSSAMESTNEDVVRVVGGETLQTSGSYKYPTYNAELVGMNGTAQLRGTMTINGITAEGTLPISASGLAEILRQIDYKLDGFDALVLTAGSTAESSVTGLSTWLNPVNEFDSVYFASSDPEVVGVDAVTGNITCLNEGSAVITAYAMVGSTIRSDAVKVTVTDDTDLASIEVRAHNEIITEANAVQMIVSGRKSSGIAADMSLYGVAWSVDDEAVATISDTGRLVGLKAGTVTVTASVGVMGKEVSACATVSVVANEEQPGGILDFVFMNSGVLRMDAATLEEDGIEINLEKTYNNFEGNVWHKGGFNFKVPVGGELVLDFLVKKSGWYRIESKGFSLYYVGCLTGFYVDDSYIGSPDFGADVASNYDAGGIFNTVWLDAGQHTMRWKAEEARAIMAGRVRLYPVGDPRQVTMTVQPAKDTLVAGEQTTLELELFDANQNNYFLHYETAVPDYTNYYMVKSSDPEVISVSRDLFTTYLTAKKTGSVNITVTAEILGETVERVIPMTVAEGNIVSAVVDAQFTTHRPNAESFPLTLTLTGLNGELSAIPEGVTVSFDSEDPQIAAVSADGVVTPGSKTGSTQITATVTEGSHVLESSLWITVTEGKSEPTVYTYEERAIAQENCLKYDWAWAEKEAAVKKADYYVENLDILYDAWIHDSFPRNARLTLLGDTEYAICPGCGTDLVAAGYGTAYHYKVDPIENPWKVTCPHCDMDFPSNDFGSFFKCGLDETGHFSLERAMANGGEQFLVNELYPERGEDWGVDNGFGWFNGEYDVNGKERGYLFISYYVSFVMYTVSGSSGPHGMPTVLNTLREAYLYTGDEKYGSAGAILVDRVADVYPGYDLSTWATYRTWYSGNAGNFGKITDLIWESILIQSLAKAVDAFWPCADNTDVVEYLQGKAYLKGMDPEDITPEYIRLNAENGILREAINSFYTGVAWGNFGLPQAAAALTAVCLDTNPETEELINWIFAASDKGGTHVNGWNTGGDVLRVLTEEVDRGGFGNEASISYNYIWLTNLLDCADALNGYDKVESANLWENPKFLNMYRAFMQVTCCGRLTYDVHETPGAFQMLPIVCGAEIMLPGFLATGDVELAQAIYSRNGNTVAGLHGDIFTKDPESGLRSQIQAIVDEYGQYNMSRSQMLSGNGEGFTILRRGPEIYLAGKNEQQFFDVWMNFGRTDTHSHFEAMNLELSAFGLPLNGNMGYPQVMSGDSYNRLQWIQHTTSNNTVVVDRSCQTRNSKAAFPLHFDNSGKVGVMDVDSPESYAQADIYRRTIVTVQGDNGVDYAVDFFRILGGSEHVYSFHGATRIQPTTENLTMVQQPMGTYEGPDVPFGDYNFTDLTGAAVNTGSGFNWLDDVWRDEAPGEVFTIDWEIEDYQHQLTTSAGIHMRLTMLSEEPMDEVALANGQPSQDGRAPDHVEFLLVKNSGEEGLDTLFTSVIEPYQNEMQVISAELVDMIPTAGTAALNERAAAVKVTLNTGRVDYIVYTTNPERTYQVDGKFTFKGFAGVATYRDGVLTYAYGNEAELLNDADLGAVIDNDTPVLTGKVVDFSKQIEHENAMTVTLDQEYPVEELAGRYIYVANDGLENGVYEIHGAVRNADGTVTLDMRHQDFVRGFVDEFRMELGYIYNIAEGQSFSIPLPTVFDAEALLNYTADTVIKTGNKLSLTTGVSDAGVTYEAEGLVSGMKFTASNGVLTWTPSKAQAGRYPITIKAVDADGTVLGEMSFVIYAVTYTGSTYDASVCTHAKAVTYGDEIVCPACGSIMQAETEEEVGKFDIAGSNMTLGNELKLNVMVKAEDLTDGEYTAKITHDGVTTEQVFTAYNASYHFVTVTVSAKQMADTITVEVFNEAGEAVSNVYETSVRDYAMKIMDNSDLGVDVKRLVVDMLNYGAAAQEYFAYNEADLANNKLNAAQKELATDTVECENEQVKGKNFYGTNLSLEEQILLNMFFTNMTEDMTAEISYTSYNGTTVSVEADDISLYTGTIYKIAIDELVLADAFSPVTVTVYNADGTIHASATDSVESYVARSGSSDLNDAIMKFASSAKNYLA